MDCQVGVRGGGMTTNARRPRVVLFNPQNAAKPKTVLPLSLLALGAVLDEVADWVLVDGNLERDPLAAVDRALRDTEADVLGVTVMPGPQLKMAVPLTRTLKARHPRVQVVWGGYFPTQHWDVVLRAEYVDLVVRGHGEFVFKELLSRLSAGQDIHDMAGLAYKDPATGAPVSNPLASIPHPD